MKLTTLYSEDLSKDVISTKDLHIALELDVINFDDDVSKWLQEHYGFRDEIRIPVENQDYVILDSAKKEYAITIELAKLITLNSSSKLKHEYAKWLLELERKKNNLELLTVEQVVFINKLIQFFGFISNQKDILKEHSEKYVNERANMGRSMKELYAFFHTWRNSKLDISQEEVNERLKIFCLENQRSISIANRSKFEQVFIMDNYETLKHAVWDFMHVNDKQEMAFKVAEITYEIAKGSNAPIKLKNENNLFQQKITTQLKIER